MTQPKLDRARVLKTIDIQITPDEAKSAHDFRYLNETYGLVQDIFDVTNKWDMSGHSYIEEVSLTDISFYVQIRWADGDSDVATFPSSILDADNPVKAARVDYLKKSIIKSGAAIRMANHNIQNAQDAIIRCQQELVKLTGSANG